MTTTLGDLIHTLYEEYLAAYGDAELASIATAATINDMLLDAETAPRRNPTPEPAPGRVVQSRAA
jgi:hypothetical protein